MKVLNEQGIHARPAAKLVETAQRFACDIRLHAQGPDGAPTVASAKEIMDVMVLALPYGAPVLVVADGPDAEDAVRALAEMFSTRFGTED